MDALLSVATKLTALHVVWWLITCSGRSIVYLEHPNYTLASLFNNIGLWDAMISQLKVVDNMEVKGRTGYEPLVLDNTSADALFVEGASLSFSNLILLDAQLAVESFMLHSCIPDFRSNGVRTGALPGAYLMPTWLELSASASLILQNVTIITACQTLAQYQQQTCCGPWPMNVEVNSTHIVLHSWSSDQISAVNVTISCADPSNFSTPVVPPPFCNIKRVESFPSLVSALQLQQEVDLLVLQLVANISVAEAGLINCNASVVAATGSPLWPQITVPVVLQASSAGSPTALDFQLCPGILDVVVPGGLVVHQNMVLTNLPLGPPQAGPGAWMFPASFMYMAVPPPNNTAASQQSYVVSVFQDTVLELPDDFQALFQELLSIMTSPDPAISNLGSWLRGAPHEWSVRDARPGSVLMSRVMGQRSNGFDTLLRAGSWRQFPTLLSYTGLMDATNDNNLPLPQVLGVIGASDMLSSMAAMQASLRPLMSQQYVLVLRSNVSLRDSWPAAGFAVNTSVSFTRFAAALTYIDFGYIPRWLVITHSGVIVRITHLVLINLPVGSPADLPLLRIPYASVLTSLTPGVWPVLFNRSLPTPLTCPQGNTSLPPAPTHPPQLALTNCTLVADDEEYHILWHLVTNCSGLPPHSLSATSRSQPFVTMYGYQEAASTMIHYSDLGFVTPTPQTPPPLLVHSQDTDILDLLYQPPLASSPSPSPSDPCSCDDYAVQLHVWQLVLIIVLPALASALIAAALTRLMACRSCCPDRATSLTGHLTTSTCSTDNGEDKNLVLRSVSPRLSPAPRTALVPALVVGILAGPCKGGQDWGAPGGRPAPAPEGPRAVSLDSWRGAFQGWGSLAKAPSLRPQGAGPSDLQMLERSGVTQRRSMDEQIQQRAAVLQPRCEEPEVVLGHLLGTGAFSKVYCGTWRGLDVAVKQLTFSESNLDKCRAAAQEVAVLLNARHPNVVPMYTYTLKVLDSSARMERISSSGLHPQSLVASSPMNVVMEGIESDASGLPCLPEKQAGCGQVVGQDSLAGSSEPCLPTWSLSIVQELCRGGTLEVLVDSGKLNNNEVCKLELALDVAKGMEYLHSKGIIHSDLKPANVLLLHSFAALGGLTAKVADFGLSVTLEKKQTHITGTRHGSWCYGAPEVLHGGHLSGAADVYSYGVVLWEMWHGAPPWRAKGKVSHTPVSLLHFHPTCPSWLQSLVTRCWAARPSSRPTFSEITCKLQRQLRDLNAPRLSEEGYMFPSISQVRTGDTTGTMSTAQLEEMVPGAHVGTF